MGSRGLLTAPKPVGFARALEFQNNVPTGQVCTRFEPRTGFGWESWKDEEGWWNKVRRMAEDIGQSGFTHIWLPPPSQSVSAEGYLPSQLYNFSSKYGDKEQLRECIQALKAHGVQAVADCVYNHRCADRQNEKGEWVIYSYVPTCISTCDAFLLCCEACLQSSGPL